MRPVRLSALALAVLAAALAGCEVHFSTANIQEAKLARDASGSDATTVFSPDDTFYCLVTLANAPSDTKVEAVWIAVEAAGLTNHEIDRKTLESGDSRMDFSLSKPSPWPPGRYKVDLYLDGKLDRSLAFEVQAGG